MIAILRTIGATALVGILLPVSIVAGLFSKGRKCAPGELASELEAFANDAEGEMAWDRLESVPIIDARLEAIRREAMTVNLPLQADDRAKLGRLASKARALT